VPTYEYECSACGNTWEEFQQITESPTRRCPKCRRLKARRLIGTGAAVLFKGSGFYVTDYRSSDYKQKARAEKDSGSSSAKTTESKSESKASSKKSGE